MPRADPCPQLAAAPAHWVGAEYSNGNSSTSGGTSARTASATSGLHTRCSRKMFAVQSPDQRQDVLLRPTANAGVGKVHHRNWPLTHAPSLANWAFRSDASSGPKASDSTIMRTRPLKSTSGFQFNERRARLESPRRS